MMEERPWKKENRAKKKKKKKMGGLRARITRGLGRVSIKFARGNDNKKGEACHFV